MTDSALDIMVKVEELDTNDLKDIQLWIEFMLLKRSGFSYKAGDNHE